jgi:type I restriction enzyme R subunit
MIKLNEDAIETLVIERLQALGYEYIHGAVITPDKVNGEAREGALGYSTSPERESFADVLLIARLRQAVKRINPTIAQPALDEAIKTIQRISSPELLANNEAFHRLLTEGVNVSDQKDGSQRGDLVWLNDGLVNY